MNSGSLWRLAAVALTIGLTLASPAAAKKKRAAAATKADIALFPLTRTADVNAELVRSLEEGLDKTLRTLYGAVYSGDALRTRLKAPPAESIDKCKGDVPCVVKLGKKLKLDEIFFGEAAADGTGVSVTASVVSSTRGKVEGKATLALAAAADVEPKLKAAFPDLFHVPYPEPGGQAGDLAMPDLVGLAMPELAPMPATAAATTPVAPAPENPPAPPATTAAPTASSPPPATAPTTTTTVAAAPLSPAPAATPTTTAHPATTAGHSRWLTYTGVGALAAGAIVAGIGVIPGMQSTSAYNKIDKNGPNTTDQLTTKDLKAQGDRNADLANLLYIVGGTLGVVGAALAAIDGLILNDAEPSVSVTPQAAAASVTIHF